MQWLYDVLVQANNEDRVAILRRIIDYPPEYESVYANLITHAFKKIKKDECPPANYKTECYREFKRAVNQFQDVFTDSGKPLRFTMKRRSSPIATATATATAVEKRVSSPVPLQPLHSNYIFWLPDWKIKGFATLISERSTDAEKRRFMQKYLHVTDEDGNPYAGLLNDIIADILKISKDDDNDNLTTESKIKSIFEHLLILKNETYPELIYVLYPFPAVHPNIFRNKRRIPTVRLLGGGGKTRRKLRRSRNRSLGMKMKGGLGPYDSVHIGMRERYSFRDQGLVDEFKMYVFGSAEQRYSWETLLLACKEMKVVVYILSAGDKIGIIRMLQLMNLDEMFEEVLCTNHHKDSNPVTYTYNESHNFQGYTKYDVIRAILRERYDIPPGVSEPLTYSGAPNGCLMDDNPANDIADIPNRNIKFVNVNTVYQYPPEQENRFYKFVANRPSLQSLITSRGLANAQQINAVTGGVLSGTYKIVFIDFDQTFQQYRGAIPFWRDDVIGDFNKKFGISTTRLY